MAKFIEAILNPLVNGMRKFGCTWVVLEIKCYLVNYLGFLDELGVYNLAGCGYLHRNKNNQRNYLCLQKAL